MKNMVIIAASGQRVHIEEHVIIAALGQRLPVNHEERVNIAASGQRVWYIMKNMYRYQLNGGQKAYFLLIFTADKSIKLIEKKICGERIYFCYIRLLHNEWCNQASVCVAQIFTEKRGKCTKNNLNIFPVDEIKHTSGHARLL